MKFLFLIKHGFLIFTLCAFLFLDLKGQNAIQDKIDWAFSNGLAEVTIPPGTYTVPFNSGVGAHLSISGKKNLTINASGVTMICSQRGSAVFINKSEGITINNLNIDYDPLPFTQGTIVDSGILGTVPYVDVIIHVGYTTATAITGQCKVEIYDATTRLIRSNIWTIYGATIEPLDLSINKFRIHNTNEFTGNTVIGDLVTLDFPSVNAHGIRIEKSKKITIGNVNLFAAPVFGIYEFLCDSNYYHDVNIVPGPLPNGATQPRLKSATADGIHSTSAKTGPKIENCRIENIGDDGIAIHGLYDYAVYASGTKLGVRTRWGSSDVYAGDSIYNLNNDGTINFRAKVLSVSSPSSSEAISMNNNWNSLGFTDKGYFDSNYILNLDRAVSIVNGTAVNSLGSQGNGFVVRNNYIHNKRARGILIKSSDGIIENNTIDWITMAGIVLAPEYYWMEAGFSRNVKIINNTLRNCGINPSLGGVQSGTISVVAESKDYKFSLAKIQQNIEIRGNHFYSCLGTNILVSSASKFNISNNVFDLPNIDHRSNGSNLGINGQFVVWLQNGDSISLFNNKVVCRPDVYLLNPGNSTHITGLSDGVLCYQNGTGVIGKGTGLCGNYYNGINFNTLIGNRLDQQVYFNWGVNKPMENVTQGNYSVRWSGEIHAKKTGKYTFYITASDGRKLWIKDSLIIDKWNNSQNNSYSGTVNLVEGQKYPIKIEFYQTTASSDIKFEWSTVDLPLEVVPKSQLYPCTDFVTGIDNYDNKKGIVIYPNPYSGGLLKIILPTDHSSEKVNLRIIDLNNKVCFNKYYSKETEISIDVANLKTGFYVVNCIGERFFTSKKLVIFKNQ